ncbi:hypothetical protein D3C78_1053550 [compost metagenome]
MVERIFRQHGLGLAGFQHHLGRRAARQFGRVGGEFPRALLRALVEAARDGVVGLALALERHVIGVEQRQVGVGHQLQRGTQGMARSRRKVGGDQHIAIRLARTGLHHQYRLTRLAGQFFDGGAQQ